VIAKINILINYKLYQFARIRILRLEKFHANNIMNLNKQLKMR